MAAATGFTAGCQSSGSDDESTEVGDEELLTVTTMLQENRELIIDIVDAQERLIFDCMEERGHTVHNGHERLMWRFQKQALPDVEGVATNWLVDREIAEEWGFGVWTSTVDMYGSEEHLEFEALRVPEGETFATVDNSAFEDLSEQDRFDWFVDFYGEERATMDEGWLIGEHTGGEGGLLGTAKPGGCMGEVTAALDLDPEFVPAPDFGEEVGTWSTFPLPPGMSVFSSGELDEQVRQERTTEEDFLICLDEAGWNGWDFNAGGNLNVHYYIDAAYGVTGDASNPLPEAFTEGAPEAPHDIATDAEGRRDWEIGFATDIWDCVDETGFGADADRAWKRVYGGHFLEMETEIYAWQEDMRELISEAQALI